MKYIFIFIITLSVFLCSTRAVFSAGANTSSDTNPGQVRLNSSDGTVYLSTSINDNQEKKSNSTDTATTSARRDTPATSAGSISAIHNPTGFARDLGSYLSSILRIVMVVSLLLVFLNFIQAGIQWITSGGDKGKTEDARNRIIHAAVGILVLSASFAVVGFVAWILGFNSINQALQSINRINPV